jgi:hypothetical protein
MTSRLFVKILLVLNFILVSASNGAEEPGTPPWQVLLPQPA